MKSYFSKAVGVLCTSAALMLATSGTTVFAEPATSGTANGVTISEANLMFAVASVDIGKKLQDGDQARRLQITTGVNGLHLTALQNLGQSLAATRKLRYDWVCAQVRSGGGQC